MAVPGHYNISGSINDRKGNLPVEYATIFIEELNIGTLSEMGGRYLLPRIPAGEYNLVVKCLGYSEARIPFKTHCDTVISVILDQQSFQLKEVNVMADYRAKGGSSATIKQAALEYIQPSSLGDIFQLLPGYLSNDGNLSNVRQMASRQSGTDKNTALGTAIIYDGAPMSNDGALKQLRGSSVDDKINSRSTINGGLDLRQISTDHLEEVEVIQGIPSVKYGNLSSGAVVMRGKSGASPWMVRLKADPLNKLLYLGKGFKLGQKYGTLHAGAELTQGKPDVRSLLETYTRMSAQLNYTQQVKWAGMPFQFNVKTYYVGTLDADKNDPNLTKKDDTYRATYNRFLATFNGKLEVGRDWLQRLELIVSTDYTSDLLDRRKTVTPTGIVPLPLSQGAGESEGIYLPAEYVSDFSIEGRPLNLYAQLSGVSSFSLWQSDHRLLWGAESSYDKNLGHGALYDITLPPYPMSASSSRPRSYRSVPALVRNALFIEDQLKGKLGNHKWWINAGVRLSSLSNLPESSRLRGKWFAEPRINAWWTFPRWIIGGVSSSLTLRGGYGEQVKFPTLDYLYPEISYFDLIALNYYSQTPENRLLWINTTVRERDNKDLSANRNRKLELGIDWEIGDFSLGLTAFRELSDQGFLTTATYFSHNYEKYGQLKNPVSGKPSITDFESQTETVLLNYDIPVNASKTGKSGVEYRLVFPEIQKLHTSIQLNGAYYKSLYDVSLPVQIRPSISVGGKPYPYVGLYEWSNSSKYREQFNSSLWINTHLPRFRLYFSAMLQAVWFTSSYSRPFNGVPVSYIGIDGVEHPFTTTEQEDPKFRDLIISYSDNYFKTNKTPVSLSLNLKATKEIGRALRVSFFVNRLWDYNPVYKTNLATEQRKWVVPSFGAEIQIKL